MIRRSLLLILALAYTLAAPTSGAIAQRTLFTTSFLFTSEKQQFPPPEGQLEGACGLAVAPNGDLFVSDYYHGYVDRFTSGGSYISQTSVGLHPEGPCGLATDSTGRLYANLWHQSALRLAPDAFGFLPGHVTGIAVDLATDNLYVDHHNLEHQSYVSIYLPSGAAAEEAGHPIDIGLGSLGDAYGIAVHAGRVYVADADANQIKVYEPAIDPDQPAYSIGNFNSLIDAALAIDPTNGHLLVVDNTQPGYEHPIAAVYEFEADGTPLGRLPGQPVFGKPSGIAVDPTSGNLWVTTGNSELSNVFSYGPYQEDSSSPGPPPAASALIGTTLAQPSASKSVPAAAASTKGSPVTKKRHPRRRHHRRRVHRAGGRR